MNWKKINFEDKTEHVDQIVLGRDKNGNLQIGELYVGSKDAELRDPNHGGGLLYNVIEYVPIKEAKHIINNL